MAVKTLHTVNKSPFESPSLTNCLRFLQPNSSILLYENAVYAAVASTAASEHVRQAMRHATVYCLEPDLSARGFAAADLVAGVEVVSYAGFVTLTVDQPTIAEANGIVMQEAMMIGLPVITLRWGGPAHPRTRHRAASSRHPR